MNDKKSRKAYSAQTLRLFAAGYWGYKEVPGKAIATVFGYLRDPDPAPADLRKQADPKFVLGLTEDELAEARVWDAAGVPWPEIADRLVGAPSAHERETVAAIAATQYVVVEHDYGRAETRFSPAGGGPGEVVAHSGDPRRVAPAVWQAENIRRYAADRGLRLQCGDGELISFVPFDEGDPATWPERSTYPPEWVVEAHLPWGYNWTPRPELHEGVYALVGPGGRDHSGEAGWHMVYSVGHDGRGRKTIKEGVLMQCPV